MTIPRTVNQANEVSKNKTSGCIGVRHTVENTANEDSGEVGLLRKVKTVRNLRSIWVVGPRRFRRVGHGSGVDEWGRRREKEGPRQRGKASELYGRKRREESFAGYKNERGSINESRIDDRRPKTKKKRRRKKESTEPTRMGIRFQIVYDLPMGRHLLPSLTSRG